MLLFGLPVYIGQDLVQSLDLDHVLQQLLLTAVDEELGVRLNAIEIKNSNAIGVVEVWLRLHGLQVVLGLFRTFEGVGAEGNEFFVVQRVEDEGVVVLLFVYGSEDFEEFQHEPEKLVCFGLGDVRLGEKSLFVFHVVLHEQNLVQYFGLLLPFDFRVFVHHFNEDFEHGFNRKQVKAVFVKQLLLHN